MEFFCDYIKNIYTTLIYKIDNLSLNNILFTRMSIYLHHCPNVLSLHPIYAPILPMVNVLSIFKV